MQLNGSRGQAVSYRGALDCVRRMVATEGAASLYRGCLVRPYRLAIDQALQSLDRFGSHRFALIPPLCRHPTALQASHRL